MEDSKINYQNKIEQHKRSDEPIYATDIKSYKANFEFERQQILNTMLDKENSIRFRLIDAEGHPESLYYLFRVWIQ